MKGANVVKNYFKVFTQKMASRLMSEGFVIQSVVPDERHVGFNIFLFNDSEQLRIRVKEIQDEIRRQKENI